MKKEKVLKDEEKILLSRLYKLDRQITAFMIHHQNISMNKLLPKTDFIQKANNLYSLMNSELITISKKRTKNTQNLVDLKQYLQK